jgi:methyl-accepting chemotaxis protein
MPLSSRQTRYLGLGALVALIALMSVLGTVTISDIEDKVESMVSEHQADLGAVDGLLSEFVEIRGHLTSFVINEETEIRPLILRISDLVNRSEALSESLHEEKYRHSLESFTGKMKEYKTAMFAYSQELLLGGAGEGIRTWETTLLETESEAHGIVSRIKNDLRGEMGDLGKVILRQGRWGRSVNVSLGLFGVLAGLLVALLLQRALARPVRELVAITDAVAGGDLSLEVDRSARDEIGTLARGIASMIDSLRNLVRGIGALTRDVEVSTGSLDQFSKEVSAGAAKQREEVEIVSSSVTQMDGIVREVTSKVASLSSTLEESSSSTQEMTASTRQISSHADRVFQELDQIISSLTKITAGMGETAKFLEMLSDSSQQAATGSRQLTASVRGVGDRAQESRNAAGEVSRQAREHGRAALEKMMEVSRRNKELADEYSSVIRSLGERSSSIGQILDVIQDVADQTNLLALNAAIIAAQAGGHGRGFAVVAEEIRKLSATTTKNVQEIGSVVEGVQEEVEKAVGLIGKIKAGMDSSAASATRTGEVLEEIEGIAARSSQMAAEISGSVGEQVGACESILETVSGNLDEVVRIRRAAEEQKSGSRIIVGSVEEIRAIAERLKQSTEEQTSGSEGIAATISRTHEFSEEITAAMTAEQETSELIVSSLRRISGVAEGNVNSAGDLDEMLGNLSGLTRKLAAEMGSKFTLPDQEE